jgi:hypothetical protein
MAGLCTLANVKVALFSTGFTDTVDDALLQLYIDAVTGEVQEYTCRQFVTDAAPSDYYFDIAGNSPNRSLYVANGVQSCTALGFAKVSQPASGGTYTSVTAANILLRPLAVDRRAGFPADTIVISDLDLTTYFYPGYNTVKATMTCGFAAIPAEIERLALALVIRRWQARKGGQGTDIGAGDFGGSVLHAIWPEERALLDRYVDVAVG